MRCIGTGQARSFATHLLEIRIIQALLGHRNVNTTARYAQVATSTIRGTPSPLDRQRLEVTPPS
jgi:integrase/recombinase XerD